MGRKIAVTFALSLLAVGALAAPRAGATELSRLVAPAGVCPGQNDPGEAADVQEQAMRCMTDFARRHVGMGDLVDSGDLDRSALDKSGDILRCDSFSHYACGRAFTFWMQRVGYIPARCWRAGENLAWGTGSYGSVRSIFRSWLHSPEHRANILGSYTQIGVGLRVGSLDGDRGVHVWTQHFGSHCGPAPRPAPARREKLARASVVAPGH